MGKEESHLLPLPRDNSSTTFSQTISKTSVRFSPHALLMITLSVGTWLSEEGWCNKLKETIVNTADVHRKGRVWNRPCPKYCCWILMCGYRHFYYASLIAYNPVFRGHCSSINLTCIILSNSVPPADPSRDALLWPDSHSPPQSYFGIILTVAVTAPSANLHSIATSPSEHNCSQPKIYWWGEKGQAKGKSTMRKVNEEPS